jgi:hypothetical protein
MDSPKTGPLDVPSLIATARSAAAKAGEEIWPGYREAPFGVLLIDRDSERLYCHPGPTADFVRIESDGTTGCEVYGRARVYDPTFRATFPAVGGVSTIVIGTPEATGLAPAKWVLTVLHEHFYQFQTSSPGYYDGVESLGLSGGDETGMWMLNYAFPYDSEETNRGFEEMVDLLNRALKARGTPGFESDLRAYLRARQRAEESVPPRDWRYIEFQLWQEGVARWTEMAIAARAARTHADSLRIDYAEQESLAVDLLMQELTEFDLREQRRLVAYPIGAAEAMLLEEAAPGWRERYFTQPYQMKIYFEGAVSRP